jgi:hypothetical protein
MDLCPGSLLPLSTSARGTSCLGHNSIPHEAGAMDPADSRIFPSHRTRSFAPSKTGYGEIDKEAMIVGVPGLTLSRPCLFIHILE